MFKTYQCHKQVQAAKIVNIVGILLMDNPPQKGGATLHFEGGGFRAMSEEWMTKHTPECGGYLVRYADGYESFSPAKAFEEGYAPLAEMMAAVPAPTVVDDYRAKLNAIAYVCHEVNRAYYQSLGDFSQPAWRDAPDWQRESARMGVDLHLSGDFGPEASHVSWMNQKLEDGWKYGPEKDPAKKEHPCMVPFAQLPREQQAKDYLFRAVVHALK